MDEVRLSGRRVNHSGRAGGNILVLHKVSEMILKQRKGVWSVGG
jgi:hypothetical protein